MVIHHGSVGTPRLGLVLLTVVATHSFVLNQHNDPKSSSETLLSPPREPRTLDSLSRATLLGALNQIPSTGSNRTTRRRHRERKLEFGLEFDEDLNEIAETDQEALSPAMPISTLRSDSRQGFYTSERQPYQESSPLSPAMPLHSGSPSVTLDGIPFNSLGPERTKRPVSGPSSSHPEARPVPIPGDAWKSVTRKVVEEVGRDRIESGPLEGVPSGTGERALSRPVPLGTQGSAHSQVPLFNGPPKTIRSSQTSSPLQTFPLLGSSLGTAQVGADHVSTNATRSINDTVIYHRKSAVRKTKFDAPLATMVGFFLISLMTLATWFTKARDVYFAQVPPLVQPPFPADLWERSFQETYANPIYRTTITRRRRSRKSPRVHSGYFGWR